ncbi:MAG: murein hydrolase activator EnvC family protein [Myxococcota bacterium]
MSRPIHSHVPFFVVGTAALVGLAVTPPPAVDGQSPDGYASGGGVERRMAQTLRELETQQDRKARAEDEVRGLADQQKNVEARLGERARALYRISRAGMLPLAGGLPALVEHAGRLQRIERLVRTDLEALRSLQTRSIALREEVNELDRSIEAAEAKFTELEGSRADRERRQGAAERFEQTFETSRFEGRRAPPGFGHGGVRVLDDAPTGLGNDFRALRGRLDIPVTGDFRAHDTDVGEGPALRFATSAGETVRAAAEGRVAFSDRHGDYGRLVIVDHGDGYYTVYGGLGSVSARVGDYIGRRARIGSVASNDGLVFEVRHRTRSLPPRQWLGL